MGQTISTLLEFEILSCPVCGVHYGIEEKFIKRKREKGDDWFCPNGHNLISKNLTIDRLEKDIKKANRKAKAGVCPCCNRTFKQLADHMKVKHPDFHQPLQKVSKLNQKINAKN
jgi:hypothetical protein